MGKDDIARDSIGLASDYLISLNLDNSIIRACFLSLFPRCIFFYFFVFLFISRVDEDL